MFLLTLPFHQFNLHHLFSNVKRNVEFAVRVNRLARFAETLILVFSASGPGFRLLKEIDFDTMRIIGMLSVKRTLSYLISRLYMLYQLHICKTCEMSLDVDERNY